MSRNLMSFVTEQIQNKEVEGAERGKHLAEMQVGEPHTYRHVHLVTHA